jgi:histidine phosphotransferase ChpT
MDPLSERHHMTEKPDITALVTARMCHDLASPIGAVGNGVELVELAGKTLGQEGELVKASVNAAAAKLKLFRIAYGQFHSEEILHAAEISAVQTAWNITGRIQVDFALQEIPKTDMKIYLLILQSIQVAMPQGAKVVVKITEGRKRLFMRLAPRLPMMKPYGPPSRTRISRPISNPTMCNLQSCRRLICRCTFTIAPQK